ncbi:PKD domain-containing protein [Nocardioides KLBMP 9356]|uniref:PKD domain-containing protein n=1 Tax=Nocardioides potassii TaxID=2911371 RepID=A0ABS9H8M5_9ACTN|nr:PKD domain-containing protein [Nocardioides potassii]MCF6376373.1 PKD domain-containing protein [Nocardioides potassii]
MPRPSRPTRLLPVLLHPLRAALALALLAATLTVAAVAATSTATSSAAEPPRTWVVDAVDDSSGNRWDSVDTGGPVLTIRVGDTVEWQFDRATMGHDLTSMAPAGAGETAWPTALQEYRDPNGAPVTYTFTQPGTYRYQCSLHAPSMTGTIVVLPADGTNQSPTAAPVVDPLTGPAPHVVHATANATDPDGDDTDVSWDFGTGKAPSYTDHAMFEYTTPGTYVVRLRVSDGKGGLYAQDFQVVVTDGGDPGTDPATDDALPTIDALAAPAQGTAPAAVAFSTEVTTRGVLDAYSVGVDAYPDLAGEVEMVRSRGRTTTTLSVTGTKPSTAHNAVHVHEQACDDSLGGAHFRFDTTQPFAEPNEIWPLFTSDAAGASGPVEVVKPMRAGPKAVSVVVHDPDNSARRIGCADLSPSTADLAYAWSFGDGTTGTGADPDHTYAAPGTYTATVTVTRTTGEHAGHLSVSDSVQVVVAGTTTPTIAPTPTIPPPTTTPTPTPPTPTADATPPRITKVGPVRTVRSARPVIKARVRDAGSDVRRKAIVLRVDGRKVTGTSYDRERGLLRWRPATALARGTHVVRLVATDTSGNRSSKRWTFTVVR